MIYKPKGDNVSTPDWCVKDILDFFKPTGIILDPCKGEGAFSNQIPNCLWCEIQDGVDFFEFNQKVDWIIGNPPYSKFRKFFQHAFDLSSNIVWLVPTWKIFSSYGIQKELIKWGGGIKHLRHYGTGTILGWSPLANLISAVYFQKGHLNGIIEQSFYKQV